MHRHVGTLRILTNMAKRPWRVLHTPDLSEQKHRSKSFSTEQAALDWARQFVERFGPGAHAYIYDRDADSSLDPQPAEHRIAWVNGALSTMTWPEMPRAQRAEWIRQMMDGMFDDDAPPSGPVWVPDYLRKARGPMRGPRRIN